MIITYQGLENFKIQFGDFIIGTNPPSKDSKYKLPRFGADIALVSINHPDFNGVDSLSHGDRKPFVINSPGEYEIKGVFIKGFQTESMYDGEKRINTAYVISLEQMNLCFLGALGTKELGIEFEEGIDDIDILFTPIGGDGVLSASVAYETAVKLEPKIIIPMHYGTDQKKSVAAFLKEGGETNIVAIDKLTIKKKDLEGKEGDIVLLKDQI